MANNPEAPKGREKKIKTSQKLSRSPSPEPEVQSRRFNTRSAALLLLATVAITAVVKSQCSSNDGTHKPGANVEHKPETKVPEASTRFITPFQFHSNDLVQNMLDLQAYWEKISLESLERFKMPIRACLN